MAPKAPLWICLVSIFLQLVSVFYVKIKHMSIILFLIILLVLVFVHEFGHFITAKWAGMRVDEFAFGFPPKIFSKKIGETEYSLNALPLGGYVSIYGEDDDGTKTNPRAFGNRPWYAQVIVLFAGVFMNMLLAYFVFVFIFYGKLDVAVDDVDFLNRPKTDERTVITDVDQKSPAYMAGLKPGDQIIEVKSLNKIANLKKAADVVSFIHSHIDNPVTITYKNNSGVTEDATLAGVYGIIENQKALGISVERVGVVQTTFIESIRLGFIRTVDITKQTLVGLKDLIVHLFEGKKVIDTLSGPVGIARMVGQASAFGLSALLSFIATLSINLAIFNLLPIPALDGGRIVMVLFETIFRRKINTKIFSWINIASFALLILLMIVVTIKDVTN